MSLKMAVIGCGKKSTQYIETWIQRDDVELVAVADTSTAALAHVSQICLGETVSEPHCFESWQEMLKEVSSRVNCVYICTPHAVHAEQALMALNAGLDVLLEKPMVTTVAEALALKQAQHESGKSVVIAYQGGLSPLVHRLKDAVEKETYGELVSVSASIWENWADTYHGHWKQVPEISGGGFMFDTGAHLMNTVSMVCAQPIEMVSALMANRGRPVDIVSAVSGRLQNGVLFTLQACGESIACTSRIECYFKQHVIRICAWGRWMEIEDAEGNFERFEQESANNLLNVFKQTIAGEMENPSSVEQGLRMAELWDAIKGSAAKDGSPVYCAKH